MELKTLPPNIEIFRAGTHTADDGTSHTFTHADVADMVSAYDPKVHEAPLCVGHPQDNKPAYGWVKSLSVAHSGALAMDTHNIAPAFAEAVNSKAFKKRSASFYPPNHPQNPKQGSWYLRHVAFLGAQPPAIKGLADFSEATSGTVEDGCINFSEALPITNQPPKKDENMDEIEKLKAEKAQLAADKAKLEADKAAAEAEAKANSDKLAEFKETQHKERIASFTSFCEKSNIKPTEKAAAVAVLAMLADVEAPVSFSEGNATKTVSPVEFVKGLITAIPAPVEFGEHMGGSGGAGTGAGIEGMNREQLHQAIKSYSESKGIDYNAAYSALAAGASFTTKA